MGDRSAHEESDYESDYLSDLPTEELANEFSSTIDMWWTSINMFSDKDNGEKFKLCYTFTMYPLFYEMENGHNSGGYLERGGRRLHHKKTTCRFRGLLL